MPRITADIAIVGGGPSGCLAAAGALMSDPALSVVIVEPAKGPRHRIGEALLTGTVMTLADAGLADEVANAGFHRKDGAAYVWGEGREPWYVNYPGDGENYPASFKSPQGRHAIHVPRHEYDRMLAGLVEARGVRFARTQATGAEVAESNEGPVVRHIDLADGTRLYAREFIDCSGQSSFLGRRLTKRLPVGGARIARYAYTASINWERATEAGFSIHRTNIVSGKNGWFWAIHLGDAGGGLTSFGFVSTPEILSKIDFGNCSEAFPETCWFGFKQAKGYPEPKTFDGKQADRFYGHPDYSQACEKLDGPNWSLAGDAALFIDPILSQGVTLASHYGFLRGKAAAARLAGYEDSQETVTLHYRREGAVMRDVVGMWYDHNRSVEDWKLATVTKAKEYGEELAPDDAFRWITNLENIRDEYDPYPEEERRKLWNRLGFGGTYR